MYVTFRTLCLLVSSVSVILSVARAVIHDTDVISFNPFRSPTKWSSCPCLISMPPPSSPLPFWWSCFSSSFLWSCCILPFLLGGAASPRKSSTRPEEMGISNTTQRIRRPRSTNQQWVMGKAVPRKGGEGRQHHRKGEGIEQHHPMKEEAKQHHPMEGKDVSHNVFLFLVII